MSRPFAIYPDSLDGNTRIYGRFGEDAGGLTGPIGPVFVNYGAEAGQDGYRFVRADGNHMDAALPGQPERSTLTLETWVRDWGTPIPGEGALTGYIACFSRDDDRFNTRIGIQVRVSVIQAQSFISAWWRVNGVTVGVALWQGMDVVDLIYSPEPWHVAAVMDNLATWRLFVNGVQRRQDTTDLVAAPAADYTLELGQILGGAVWYGLDGVLDEPRLSDSARYPGGVNGTRYFWPVRYGEGRRALTRGPGTHAGLFAGVRA